MKVRLASNLQVDSIVDGEGIRTVIWTQGCPHNCPGCHNPSTHDFNEGTLIDVEEIIEELSKLSAQDGITFSGGDPMYQAKACMKIAKAAKNLGLSVWCYTGDLFEDILENKNKKEFLNYIDVLVDGKFELDKRNLDLMFKGSSNQRIIDVRQSLKEKRVVLIDKYNVEKEYHSLYKKSNYMFI